VNRPPFFRGTISSWALIDQVGRVRLTSGEEVRFGRTACTFAPSVGLEVEVQGLEPHPLGGQRAIALVLAHPEQGDSLLDAASPLPGTQGGPEELQRFSDLTDDVGFLGVVLRTPLTTRAALRAWLARAGLEVDFSDARAPLVRPKGVPYRVLLCASAVAGGEGVFSFAQHGAFSLEEERVQALAGVSLGHTARVDTFDAHAPLVAAVSRAARDEVEVIAHQARGFLVPPAEWTERHHQDPLSAWVKVDATPGRDAIATGFRALLLPDLFLSKGSGPGAAELLMDAGRALVALGRPPAPGEALGRCVVRTADCQWLGLSEAPED
jgi:hypothetical protein